MAGKIIKKFNIDPDVGNRLFLVFAVLGMLVLAILLSNPTPTEEPKSQNRIAPSPASTLYAATPTSELNKVTSDYANTTGIVIAVITVLVIIELGVLYDLWKTKKEDK